MAEQVSWQELLRVCGKSDNDDEPVSPVFLKNKWVIVRKPRNLTEPTSSQLSDKRQSNINIMAGCEIVDLPIPSTSSAGRNKVISDEICCSSETRYDEDQQCTPTSKNRSAKRKLIDNLLLENSLLNDVQVSKKSKVQMSQTSDKERSTTTEILDNLKQISIEKNAFNAHDSSSAPENCLAHLNKAKRKLLYSANRPSSENKPSPQNFTINDFYKSVIMLEESDKIVPSKGHRPPEFVQLSQEFVSVSDLNNMLLDISTKETESKMNAHENPILNNTHASAKLNDTLNNFQFTEVEEFHCPKVTNLMAKGHNESLKLTPCNKINLNDEKFSESNIETNDNSENQMDLRKDHNSSGVVSLKPKSTGNDQQVIRNDQNSPVGPKYTKSSDQNDVKQSAAGYLNVSSDKSRSDFDLRNIYSKFKEGFQDSVAFDEISTQCNNLECKTPSQTDMFDHKTPSKDDNLVMELTSESDLFDNDSPIRCSSPLKDEMMTPELNKTSLSLSKSLSIKRVKQNLMNLLTPNSERNAENPKSQIQNNLENFAAATNDSLRELESEPCPRTDKSVLEPVLKLNSPSPSKRSELKSKSDLTDYSTHCLVPNESIDTKLNSDTEESEEKRQKEKVQFLLESIIDSKPREVLSREDFSDDFITTDSTLVQFSTASGSVVCASKENIKKAKTLMKNAMEENASHLNTENNKNEKSLISEDIPPFEISRESLSKAKALLGDALECVNNERECTQKCNLDTAPGSSSNVDCKFSTARGSNVHISEGSLRKIETLFSDVMDQGNDLDIRNWSYPTVKLSSEIKRESPIPSTSKHDSSLMSPITTCTSSKVDNKNCLQSRALPTPQVMPEENSTVASKSSLSDIRNSHSSHALEVDKTSEHTFDSSHLNISTAGGLDVKASIKSLGRAKSLKEECTMVLNKNSVTGNIVPQEIDTVFDQQKTGKITLNVLRNDQSTEDKNSDISRPDNLPTFSDQNLGTSLNPVEHVSQPFVFSTAGGRAASISEDSLKKARALIQEDSLFEVSKEESYNFSSVGDETILMVKEETGKIKFKNSSENSQSSQIINKTASLPENENETTTTDETKKIMSQNLSVFELKQCIPCDYQEPSCSKLNLRDLPLNSKESELQLCSSAENISSKNFSLSNARGKTIDISNEVLERVKLKFKDIMESVDDNDSLSTNFPVSKINNFVSAVEAQECSRKTSVDFTLKNEIGSLKLEEPGFEEDDSFSSDSICTQTLLKLSKENKSNSHKSSAAGDVINTSEVNSSLNVKNECNNVSNEPIGNFLLCPSLSFSTANGLRLQISEESLLKMKTRFKDELSINESDIPKNIERSSPSLTKGYEEIVSHKSCNKCIHEVEPECTDTVKQSDSKEGVSFSSEQGATKTSLQKLKEELNTEKIDSGLNSQMAKPFPNIQNLSFSTAKGDKVNVSEQCLERVKLKFKNELESSNLDQIEDLNSFTLQNKQTCSSRRSEHDKVDVSVESIKKVKQLLKDDFKETDEIEEFELLKSSKSNKEFYFLTAQGGKETISEESLHKVKVQFKNEIYQTDDSKVSHQPLEMNLSVSTPSSSKVTSQELLNNFNLQPQAERKEIYQGENILKPHQNKHTISFATAIGGKLNVSEDSLLRVKQQFSDKVDAKGISLGESVSLYKPSVKKPRLSLSYSKRNLNTSGVSSQKSVSNVKVVECAEKSGLNDNMNIIKPSDVSQSVSSSSAMEVVDKESRQNENISFTELSTKNTGCFSFTTAQGGKVNVSEESLQKVELQFRDDVDDENDNKIKFDSIVKPSSSNPSFSISSALGGKIVISDTSLEKVRKKFKDELDITESSIKAAVMETGCTFATTQGGKINVSKERLQKIKQQFNDDVDTTEDHKRELNSPVQPCQGVSFSTALGGKVPISSEGLEKVKEMFKNELDNKESHKSDDISFKTAQGGRINVSEESLQKVKQKFKEDIGTIDENHIEFKSIVKPCQSSLSFSFSSSLEDKVPIASKSLENVNETFQGDIDIKDQGSADKISLDESVNKTGFTFKTAQGGKVNVSEESLQKIQEQFKDDFDTAELKSLVKPCPNKQGFSFSTALGGKIPISAESLEKAKEKFKDEIDIIEYGKDDNISLRASVLKTGFNFTTAQGGKINVSDESLQKVKQQFKEDIGTIDENTLELKSLVKPCPNKQGFSFSSALGGKIPISAESLEKAKEKFKDEIDIIESGKDDNISLRASVLKTVFNFTTAQGGKINVSDESLQKVKQQFKEDIGTIDENTLELKSLVKPCPNKQGFSFSTALGGKIPISAESLEKAKEKFKDEIDIIESGKDDNISLRASVLKTGFNFTTAQGGKINVSDESLQKVKQQFKEDIGTIDENTLELKSLVKPSQSSLCFSFSTALGGKVLISDESLEKAKEKFKDEIDIKESITTDNVSLNASENKAAFTFTTAQGGKVNVSKESLQKIQQQFNDFFSEEDQRKELNNLGKPCQSSLSVSFSSALEEKVPISDKSCETVKEKIKDEIDTKESCKDDNISLRASVLKSGFNFTTAQGGKISVSEESLRKVHQQFRDDFDTSEDQIIELKSLIKPCPNETTFSFSTALGGKIPISNKSLEKVKEKFKDEIDVKESGKNDNTLGASRLITGFNFTTAQGGKISVSEESLQKVKHQFHEELELDSSFGLKPVLKIQGSSFTTAKDEKCSVPEESLEKIQRKFKNDLDKIDSNNLQSKPLIPSLAHSTNELLSNFSHALEGSQLNEHLNHLEKSFNTDSLANSKGQKNFLSGDKQSNECKSQKTFEFTQTIKGSNLEDELNRIESNMKNIQNKTSASGDCDIKSDSMQGNSPKDVCIEDVKEINFFSQMCSEDMLLMCEITDSAAALAQGSQAFKPIITTPSGISDRSQLKPINSWPLELENDDDIIAAVQTPKKNDGHTYSLPSVPHEKRKPDSESVFQPSNKKAKLSGDSVDNQIDNDEIIAKRLIRRKEQQTKIENKKQCSSVISEGLYMSIRKNQTLTTFMNSGLNDPRIYSAEKLLEMGLFQEVIDVTSRNATDFKFMALNYFPIEDCFSKDGQINLGNGFIVVLSNDYKIGLEEISASFLSHPHVDPSLVHRDWIRNHYRWIVWKLACLEKSFPQGASRRHLVPVNVLHQLKYRYDREIDLAQRPALRRILECDSPPSRRFVACVADIRKIEPQELEPSVELELTDGWYSVWSTIDPAMETLINKGKIKIGTKLIIQGAELVNCSDGCDPLELKESIRLKLHTNSVRRVKWFQKMGFTKYPGPMGISIDSILPDGGLVGLTTAVIARVYPMLFMSRDENGKSVIRNSQAQNHFAAIREKERNSKTEELYEKILNEVQEKYKKGASVKYDLKSIKQITDPEVLWRIVSNESDASEVHSLLNPDQLDILKKYHENISAKIRDEVNNILKEKLEELVPVCKVTKLLKIRIADPLTESTAIVTIWRPNEDVCNLLTENRYIDFYGLNACGTREKVLQLTNTKHSCYRVSTLFTQTNKFQRKITDISDLVFHNIFPVFGELDVVGIVVYVKEPDKPWGVTNVYLSDIRNHFLMITFWTSLKNLGFEELLREGSVVAGVNLHRRQGSGSYVVPSTFANEITYFSSNPPQKYLSKEIQVVKDFLAKKDTTEFLESKKEFLLSLLKDRGCNTTPVRVPREGVGVSKRLDLLKNYGSASPLPAFPLVSSPDVHKSFKSPSVDGNTPKRSRTNYV